MASKITKIASGIAATLGMVLGIITAALADDTKRPPVMKPLPPKSCTWMGSGADHFQVVASGKTTFDTDSKTTWKCNNGAWSQVGGKPVKDTRPNFR